MNITQIQDYLVAINDKVDEVELLNVTLRGIHRYWEQFLQGINA
jgi:hypothetical protein